MPEPDLPPVTLTKEEIEALRDSMPELPRQTLARLEGMGASPEVAALLVERRSLLALLEDVLAKGTAGIDTAGSGSGSGAGGRGGRGVGDWGDVSSAAFSRAASDFVGREVVGALSRAGVLDLRALPEVRERPGTAPHWPRCRGCARQTLFSLALVCLTLLFEILLFLMLLFAHLPLVSFHLLWSFPVSANAMVRLASFTPEIVHAAPHAYLSSCLQTLSGDKVHNLLVCVMSGRITRRMARDILGLIVNGDGRPVARLLEEFGGAISDSEDAVLEAVCRVRPGGTCMDS